MKKLLSLLLVFSLLLGSSLLSCEQKTEKPKDEDEKKEPIREITAEEKAIFDEVIAIMENDTYDTNAVIDYFCGDFMIDGIQSQTIAINKIYKIGDVLAVENTNGETVYQIVKDSKLYTINRTNDGAKLNLESEQEYPYDYPLSIFTAIGVDMSPIYISKEAAENEPKLTYDALELSKDKKSVTFTDEYLGELARYLCSSFDAKDKDVNKFIENMTASGEFVLENQTAAINIEGNIKGVGDIKIEMSLAFKDLIPLSSTSSISVTTEIDGVPVTTTVEQVLDHFSFANDYQELRGFDGEIVTTTESKTTQNGIEVTYTNSVKNAYKFFSGTRGTCYIETVAKQAATAGGQTQVATSDFSLTFTPTTFWFETRVNKEYLSGLNAQNATMGTPQNVTIPEDIYTVLPK